MKKLMFIGFLIAVSIAVVSPQCVFGAGTFNTALGTSQVPGELADETNLWTILDAARDDVVALEAGALGSDGNWGNDGTNVVLDANSGIYAVNASGLWYCTGLVTGVDDLTLQNGQMILGNSNNNIILQENSDTLTIGFDADDINLTCADGGFEFITENSDADGTIDFFASADTNDYIRIITTGDAPALTWVGCDGIITAAGADISFDDENLVTTGTLGCAAFTGSSTGSFGSHLTLEESEYFDNSTDDTVKIISDSTALVFKVISGGDATNAELIITCDKDDDAADDWTFRSVASDNDLHILGANTLRLTIDVNGNILTTNDLTVGGTTPQLAMGDAGDEDAAIIWNAATQDYYTAKDDTGGDNEDIFIIAGAGHIVGTTPGLVMSPALELTSNGDMNIIGTTPRLTMGDGGAEDTQINFDGVANYYVGIDDTGGVAEDLFTIGRGFAAGTTPGISIDSSGNLSLTGMTTIIGAQAMIGDQVISGTTPQLTVGDAGAEDTLIVFDGVTADMRLGIDDTGGVAEDLFEIGVGATPATDVRLAIDSSSTITWLTVGDGVDAEDKVIVFDGNAVDFHLAMDDGTDDFIIGLGGIVGTTPGLIIDGADASCSIGAATGAVIATGANDLYIADACEVAGDLSTSVNMTISNPVSISGVCYIMVIKADGTVGKSALAYGVALD